MGVDSTLPNTPPLLQQQRARGQGQGVQGRGEDGISWLGMGQELLNNKACMDRAQSLQNTAQTAAPGGTAAKYSSPATLNPPDGEGASRHFINRQGAVTRLPPKVVNRLQAAGEGNGGRAESGSGTGRREQHLPYISPNASSMFPWPLPLSTPPSSALSPRQPRCRPSVPSLPSATTHDPL